MFSLNSLNSVTKIVAKGLKLATLFVRDQDATTAPARNGVDTPLGRHPTRADTPSLGYYGIWSTSGRYTSYWNAYSFVISFMCNA